MTREDIFHELMEATYRLSEKINAYESIPRTYGTEDELYMMEAHTLNLIGDLRQTNVSEIARLMKKTKGAVSQMIDRLDRKDLISKTKNQNDQRGFIIQLTDKGSKVYDYHKELDKENYRQLLEHFPEFSSDDLKVYIAISERLAESIG